MLPRQDPQQKVSLMQRDIRRLAQESTSSPHKMLPSLRQMAQSYGISHSLAAQSLKSLIEEGVVYSVPRVGIFVGRPKTSEEGVYLLLLTQPENNSHCISIQVGFEERIAQLGGTCLTLDREATRDWHSINQLPRLAGIFGFVENHSQPQLWNEIDLGAPCVEFGELLPDETPNDRVYFDNIGGGRQATQHLLDLGHREVAFLGLHGTQDHSDDFIWSQKREIGWRETLENTGCITDDLIFRPGLTPGIGRESQERAAEEAAKKLVSQSKASAVVVVNWVAAYALIRALRAAKIAVDSWPAMVSFDADFESSTDSIHLTALRLSWEDIGRAAADLLWARSHGDLEATPQKRPVPMRLIKRLTSQNDWAQRSVRIEDQLQATRLASSVV